MVEVIGADEFASWYGELGEEAACAVSKAITVLESVGVDASSARPLESRAAQILWAQPGAGLGATLERVALYQLPVGESLVVLFALEEPGARVVLLYGYDASLEACASMVAPLAHIVLAARVYRLYCAEVA